MAHTICRGVTWGHSKLGGNPDGSNTNCKFQIDDHPDAGKVAITGKHLSRGNANLLSGTCDGNFLSFAVEDPTNNNLLICYIKGKYSSAAGIDHINGKFSTPLAGSAAVSNSAVRKNALAAADDWEADKTT